MKKWISCFCFLSLMSCGLTTKRAELQVTEPVMPVIMSCEELVETAPEQYTASRQLSYADCLFERGEVQSALDTYEKVYNLYKLSSPAIKTKAIMGKSKVFERKGDWTKSLIFLKEAEPFVVRKGEPIERVKLFLQLGTLYLYLGEKETAQNYINKAEKEFAFVPNNEQKAEVALAVAQFYNDYMMPKDFEPSLEVFRRSIPYMVYVIANGDLAQRTKTLKRFEDAEMNFYRLVSRETEIKATFKPTDDYEFKSIQRDWLQKLADVSDEARLLVTKDALNNAEMRDLRAFLDSHLKQLEKDMFAIRKENPLTPESSVFHSIKRPGTVFPTILLPGEK